MVTKKRTKKKCTHCEIYFDIAQSRQCLCEYMYYELRSIIMCYNLFICFFYSFFCAPQLLLFALQFRSISTFFTAICYLVTLYVWPFSGHTVCLQLDFHNSQSTFDRTCILFRFIQSVPPMQAYVPFSTIFPSSSCFEMKKNLCNVDLNENQCPNRWNRWTMQFYNFIRLILINSFFLAGYRRLINPSPPAIAHLNIRFQ